MDLWVVYTINKRKKKEKFCISHVLLNLNLTACNKWYSVLLWLHVPIAWFRRHQSCIVRGVDKLVRLLSSSACYVILDMYITSLHIGMYNKAFVIQPLLIDGNYSYWEAIVRFGSFMPMCFRYMCLCSYMKMPGHIPRDKSIICTVYLVIYWCKLPKSVILSNISFLACLMVYMHLFVLISCL